ncbi:hypothetical protein QBC34DRAFT_415790 [Podospora aff. communis PSN243]|uniref:Uncharacterized protein n=1 Tax=Podospora aff. communis PSN243 TaxID=3040156 RepID=A0AAV9G7N8_9PEZI|nr:hypothetical protein QBC34DRAFT_415790 [Podospora aff. communis PSN243]
MSQALDDLRRAVLGSPSSSPDQTLVAYTNEEQNRAFVAVMFRRLFEELGYYTLKEQVGDDEEMLLKRSSSEGAPWRLFCNFISRGPIERCLRGLPQPQREICVAVMKNMHQNLKKLPQGPIAGRFPTDAEIDTAGLKEIAYPFGARLSSGELLKGSQIARHGISKEALQKAMMKILKMLRPTVEDGKVNWMKELDRHIDRNALRARGQLGKMDRLR